MNISRATRAFLVSSWILGAVASPGHAEALPNTPSYGAATADHPANCDTWPCRREISKTRPSDLASTYRLVENRNYHGELLDTPVYDPISKSYFEMVDGSHGMVKGPLAHEGPNWTDAYRLAQGRVFKGVHGRLAVVKSLETHEFLMRTFRPETYVWIGLRYWCTQRKLQWSDGTIAAAGSFQAWDKVWRQDVYACASGGGDKEFMPVAYSPLPKFDWIGKGIQKRYYYFFVEYPTGNE